MSYDCSSGNSGGTGNVLELNANLNICKYWNFLIKEYFFYKIVDGILDWKN
jgi:hypothetical protein